MANVVVRFRKQSPKAANRAEDTKGRDGLRNPTQGASSILPERTGRQLNFLSPEFGAGKPIYGDFLTIRRVGNDRNVKARKAGWRTRLVMPLPAPGSFAPL
jgi:hypothetical protein